MRRINAGLTEKEEGARNMKSMNLSRRGFLAAQTCVAAGAVSGLAHAERSATWQTATPKEMNLLKKDKFRARFEDGTQTVLTLAETQSCRSGWARPLHLRRREGVTLSFECDASMAAKFESEETSTLTIEHQTLGRADLFLTAVPMKSGKIRLEAVLN